MNGGNDMAGIDGRFRRAGRLLSRHAVLQGLLVVAGCLQLTVVGSVLLARSWVAPALLRQALPWTTLALLGLSGLWLLRARSPRRLRNRVVRLLVADDPAAHADVHAYYADNLVGGIRDEAVREICRDRLAQHLAERGGNLPGFRLDALPLLGWLTVFALIWLLPWLWGFTPPRLVADFRRLLRLRTTPLTVLSFAPEQEWLQPARSTALRVTFGGTPMEEVQALLTDQDGETTTLPLRASGDVYAASFVTPSVPFQLQLACESRLTPPRSYQVFPIQVVSLVSVEILDGTGKVVAVRGPTDLPLTVRFGRRLRWHVQAVPCPLRAYGVGSRSATVTRGAQSDVWESVAEADAEYFTFWEAHGEAPIVQDRFLVKVIPDAPPEVTLTAPPELAALPLTLRVSAVDDSAVLRGAAAVADLHGWQQILPLELEPEGTGAKATLTLADKDLEGRTGRYLMVWAVAEDDGAPVNQGVSSPRFYVLPDQQPPEPQPEEQPEERPPPPENDLAAALQDNLDRMGQQAETPEEGESAPADRQENAATPPAQGDPGRKDQGDESQAEGNQPGQPGGEEPTIAQGDQNKDQPGQAAEPQAEANPPGQPGGTESSVAQGDPGKQDQAEGDQPGQPGGQAPSVVQDDPGKQGQNAEAQGEGDQPGQRGGQENSVAQGDGQASQGAEGEGGAQPGQPGGQGNTVAQGDGQPGQGAEGQGGAQPGQGGNQPGQPGGQEGDVAQGDGQPGQGAEGQGGAQPGQGGNQPGQPGQGAEGQGGVQPGQGGNQPGQPGGQENNVAQGDGQPGQGAEGQGGAQPGQVGNPPGQPGGQADGVAQGDAQPGQGEVAQGGQGAEQSGQGGGGSKTEPDGKGGEGEGAAKAPTVAGTEGTGEPQAEQPVAGPGEGGGEGEAQQVQAHGGGADGAPPPVPPAAQGPRQTDPDTVDEALRQAAAQEGLAASENRGAVLPAAGEAGPVASDEAPAAHGQWGPGQTVDEPQVAVGDAPAPTEDIPAPERVTEAELGAGTGEPLAEVDTTLVGAGGSGSRTALADSPVEQAIRAHEEAMRKLTGSEKAATREYYRRLKDIR